MQRILILLLLANPLLSISQRDSTKRVYFSEFQFQPGYNDFQVNQMSKSEFLQFVPNSNILTKDYSSFEQGHLKQNITQGYFSMFLGLGFESAPNQRLRIGVTSFRTENYNNTYSLNETFPYDTLTSAQTGEQTIIDTTNYSSLDLKQTAQNITLNVDYLYFLNVGKRISFFTGIGLAGGIGFNVQSSIYYQKTFDEPQGIEQTSSPSISDEEVYFNPNYFVGSAYVPLGVRLKLGTKRKFWKNLSLSAEYKALLNVSTTLPSRTTLGFGNRFGVGFIFHW